MRTRGLQRQTMSLSLLGIGNPMRAGILLLIVLLGGLWAEPLSAQTLVDNAYLSVDNTNDEVSVMVDVQAGDTVVPCPMSNSTAAGTLSISDSRGHTYNHIDSHVHNTTIAPVRMFWTRATVTETLTVTQSSVSPDYQGIFVQVWRGLDVSPVDDFDHDDEVADATASTPALTAVGVGVSIGCLNIWSAGTISPGMDWDDSDEDESFSNIAGSMIYQVTTAGSYTPNWTNSNETWTAVGATFKVAASATPKCRWSLFGFTLCLTASGGGSPEGFDAGGYRPHYQGFAYNTPGGRGGALCTVTTLTDTDSPSFDDGTLRGCFEERPGCDGSTPSLCAAFVVFNKSGRFDCEEVQGNGLTHLILSSPYRTFAGQTAPAGTEGTGSGGSTGVAIMGCTVLIKTHDVVLQHLRIRRGNCGDGDLPALQLGDFIETATEFAYNIVADHLSVSWGCNNTSQFSINKNSYNILVLDSLLAEPIWSGGGDSGINLLFYSSTNCTGVVARTLIVNVGNRNIWASSHCRVAQLNTLVYNAHTISGADGTYSHGIFVGVGEDYTAGLSEFAYLHNVNIPGPNTVDPDGTVSVQFETSYLAGGNVRLRMVNNTGPNITGDTDAGQEDGVSYSYDANAGNTYCDTSCYNSGSNFDWFKAFDYQLLPTADVQASLLTNAGAFPLYPDETDTRLRDDVLSGGSTGDATISAPPEDPTYAERTRAYVDPSDPNDPGDCGASRTNRECRALNHSEYGALRLEDMPDILQ